MVLCTDGRVVSVEILLNKATHVLVLSLLKSIAPAILYKLFNLPQVKHNDPLYSAIHTRYHSLT